VNHCGFGARSVDKHPLFAGKCAHSVGNQWLVFAGYFVEGQTKHMLEPTVLICDLQKNTTEMRFLTVSSVPAPSQGERAFANDHQPESRSAKTINCHEGTERFHITGE